MLDHHRESRHDGKRSDDAAMGMDTVGKHARAMDVDTDASAWEDLPGTDELTAHAESAHVDPSAEAAAEAGSGGAERRADTAAEPGQADSQAHDRQDATGGAHDDDNTQDAATAGVPAWEDLAPPPRLVPPTPVGARAATASSTRPTRGSKKKKKASAKKKLGIADPFVMAEGNTWYAYGTGLKMFSSTDAGASWTGHGRMFSVKHWAKRWAPEVHKVGGQYVAYMGMAHEKKQHAKIMVATASSPMQKPWKLHKKPIVKNKGWSNIDPTFIHTKTGKNYLLWKQDRQKGKGRKRIVMKELDATGTQLAHSHGKAKTLLVAGKGKNSGRDYRPGKKNPSVEAPTLVWDDKTRRYWLFYSGAGFERGAGYHVGVASSKTIGGPYKRMKRPLVRGDAGAHEPGHQTIIKVTVNGKETWVIMFHARGKHGKARYLLKDQIRWRNGKPYVHDGTPSQRV